jgi:hypothetical protein
MPAKGFRYDVADRLAARSQRTESGCRVWTGQKNRGYGVIELNGRREKAHRASWICFVGALTDGECVLHRCDNPACIDPAHLFVGTKGDNNRDRHRKGRSRNQHTRRGA